MVSSDGFLNKPHEFSSRDNNIKRAVVLGSSGWFGKNAMEILRNRGIEVLPLASSIKSIEMPGFTFQTNIFDLAKVNDFCPELVIDAAFLTREYFESVGENTFRSTNEILIEQAMEIAKIQSVKKFMGFSSGAVHDLNTHSSISAASRAYAELKANYEDRLNAEFCSSRKNLTIMRTFSVSGRHANRVENFAFTEFIRGALSGKIEIRSSTPTFRRYVSIADILEVGLKIQDAGVRFIESGGNLIEMQELAEKIAQQLNPKTKIFRDLKDEAVSIYASDNKTWLAALDDTGHIPQTLEKQILDTAAFIRA